MTTKSRCLHGTASPFRRNCLTPKAVRPAANLRGAIDQGESEAAIKKLALSPHDTLTGQGLQAVADGRVSLAEALRIVGDVT